MLSKGYQPQPTGRPRGKPPSGGSSIQAPGSTREAPDATNVELSVWLAGWEAQHRGQLWPGEADALREIAKRLATVPDEEGG